MQFWEKSVSTWIEQIYLKNSCARVYHDLLIINENLNFLWGCT